jgi:hypothetical protein
MAGAFDGAGQYPLVFHANSGSARGENFSLAGQKLP